MNTYLRVFDSVGAFTAGRACDKLLRLSGLYNFQKGLFGDGFYMYQRVFRILLKLKGLNERQTAILKAGLLHAEYYEI